MVQTRNCKNIIKQICQKLFENPLAKELYENAMAIHSFTIEIREEQHLDYFAGHANCFDNGYLCICIAKEYSLMEQLCILIFEITNIIHFSKFNNVNKDYYPMRRSVYIKINEHVEYDGVKIAYKIIKHGVNFLNWNCDITLWKNATSQSFEEYFQELDNNHKEVYGVYWDSMQHA